MSPLTLTLLIPLITAGMIALLSGEDRRAPYRIALAGAALLFLSCFSIAFHFASAESVEGFRFLQESPWIPRLGLSYLVGVDGISLFLLLLTGIVTLAAVGVSSGVEDRPREFFIHLMLISAGAVGAFISLDLFFLYVFHELALIPTFLLIGRWGNHANRERVATKLTVYLSLGSLILLAGLLMFYFLSPVTAEGTHTFNLITLRSLLLTPQYIPGSIQPLIYGFVLVGSGILISLWPFHSWAPQGYAGAPAAASMLHAGVLKKFGLYLLIRFAEPLLPQGAQSWVTILSVLLLMNILYVGYVAMSEKNLRLMLGYSSVSHMGYVFLGIVAANSLGLTGALVYMFAHGLTAALGFALAGHIARQTGTVDTGELGGLARKMPFAAVVFTMTAMASAGMPGFANFAGELMIFFGAWYTEPALPFHGAVVVLALFGVVVSSVYMLRAVRNVFLGELPEKFSGVRDIEGLQERLPYLLLLAGLMITGFVPGLLTSPITSSLHGWMNLLGK
ncbi:MAG: NADH-quinone oxidoreductase subunit M [Verrucomicrobiae bacterium]|nr:NADH-quinone oxidoreductase subunit M [Verrucomicrobiae bacterium]